MVSQISANSYMGLSTDVKPTGNVNPGSFFLEVDTKKVFIYDWQNANKATLNGWWPL